MDKRELRKLSVVIPACNEEESIGKVLRDVRDVIGNAVELIVVDDGSTDATAGIAKESGAVVVTHPYRKGNGAAIKTGVRAAGGDIIVLMDGDGQHPAELIPQLVEPMDLYEMVIGARRNVREISILRYIGNTWSNQTT